MTTFATRAEIGNGLGVTTETVDRWSATRRFPAHAHATISGTELWSVADIDRHFAGLIPDLAAFVPAVDPALSELNAFGVYACPARSDWLGLHRPSIIGLCTRGTVAFYAVTAATTIGKVGNGLLSIARNPAANMSIVNAVVAFRSAAYPITVFELSSQLAGAQRLTRAVRGVQLYDFAAQTANLSKNGTHIGVIGRGVIN